MGTIGWTARAVRSGVRSTPRITTATRSNSASRKRSRISKTWSSRAWRTATRSRSPGGSSTRSPWARTSRRSWPVSWRGCSGTRGSACSGLRTTEEGPPSKPSQNSGTGSSWAKTPAKRNGPPQWMSQGMPNWLQGVAARLPPSHGLQGMSKGLPQGRPRGMPQGLSRGTPPETRGLSSGLPRGMTCGLPRWRQHVNGCPKNSWKSSQPPRSPGVRRGRTT